MSNIVLVMVVQIGLYSVGSGPQPNTAGLMLAAMMIALIADAMRAIEFIRRMVK